MMRKWRPSLAFVLGGALCGTLAVSLVGLIAYRYLGADIGFRDAAVILGILIAAATAFLGWLLVRLLLRPILDLQRYANTACMNAPSDTPKPTHFGTRELRATATSVIDMADTLRNREASIRTFSDHISHELKTPVSVIRAATELLQDSAALAPDDKALVDQIVDANDQMEGHLHAMRQVVQAREVQHTGSATVQDVAGDLRARFPDLTLDLSGETTTIPLAATGLAIVFGHLLDNAAAHGATMIDVAATDHADGVKIAITDNGRGISAGNITRVFDPFFTTRRADGGTGMGLSIVQNILRAHGGSIDVVENEGGAAFEIRFARA